MLLPFKHPVTKIGTEGSTFISARRRNNNSKIKRTSAKNIWMLIVNKKIDNLL